MIRHPVFLTVALLTLTACGGGQRTDQPADTRDARYAQAADAAYLAYVQGLPDQAARLYGTAMDRARLIDDRPAFIDAAYNRAYCYYLLADYDAADRDLVEALAINAGAPKPAPTAALLLLRGEIARARGDADTAARMIESATSDPMAMPNDRARAHLLRGYLAADRGEAEAAKAIYDQTAGMLESAKPAESLLMERFGLAARVFELQGNEFAAIAYDQEAEFARGIRRYRRMARALGDSGRMYAKQETWDLAADRYFAAARSYASFDDRKTAADLAAKAADAASRTDSDDLKAAIADLVRELSGSP